MRVFALICCIALAACSAQAPAPEEPGTLRAGLPSPDVAAENFIAVVDQVEPVAERLCRAEMAGPACDFQIVVDSRTTMAPNAFQTVDRAGRPVIVFTVSLIAEARNRDELAFVLGHEAAHHIAGHLARQRDSALRGAVLNGVLAKLNGANARAIRRAQDVGAQIGARVYSKEFELEADALGTVIAYEAGYDPLLGAQFFTRLEDPGNVFLGTHPPNSARLDMVRRVVAGLR